MESLKKALKVERNNAEKDISLIKKESEKELSKKANEITLREKEVAEKEKSLAALANEQKRIADEWEKIKNAKKEIEGLNKSIESLKISSHDKIRQAELMVEQYTKKLNDLNVKIVAEEVKVEKKVKKSKEK